MVINLIFNCATNFFFRSLFMSQRSFSVDLRLEITFRMIDCCKNLSKNACNIYKYHCDRVKVLEIFHSKGSKRNVIFHMITKSLGHFETQREIVSKTTIEFFSLCNEASACLHVFPNQTVDDNYVYFCSIQSPFANNGE